MKQRITHLRLKKIGEETGFDRIYYKDVDTKRIYCTVEGELNTCDRNYGEPDTPIRKDITVEYIGQKSILSAKRSCHEVPEMWT